MVNVGKYIGHIYPMGIEKQFQSKYLGICFCAERTTVMTGTHRIDKAAHETASLACLWPASCLGHVGPAAAAHVKGSMARPAAAPPGGAWPFPPASAATPAILAQFAFRPGRSQVKIVRATRSPSAISSTLSDWCQKFKKCGQMPGHGCVWVWVGPSRYHLLLNCSANHEKLNPLTHQSVGRLGICPLFPSSPAAFTCHFRKDNFTSRMERNS